MYHKGASVEWIVSVSYQRNVISRLFFIVAVGRKDAFSCCLGAWFHPEAQTECLPDRVPREIVVEICNLSTYEKKGVADKRKVELWDTCSHSLVSVNCNFDKKSKSSLQLDRQGKMLSTRSVRVLHFNIQKAVSQTLLFPYNKLSWNDSTKYVLAGRICIVWLTV